MTQHMLEDTIKQGSDFYTRLVEHLAQLKLNVSDFKNARTLQATELCKQLGVAPPGAPLMPHYQPVPQPGIPSGAPQGMPPQGGFPPPSGQNPYGNCEQQNEAFAMYVPPSPQQPKNGEIACKACTFANPAGTQACQICQAKLN